MRQAAGRFILSNLHTFRELAHEALGESERLLKTHRRPRADGEPGYVITADPGRRSFKQALVAIAFAGMYLDALLRIEMIRRLGMSAARDLEFRSYEKKLTALGIGSDVLHARTTHFREVRNDLMHEEPIVEGENPRRMPEAAQDQARLAIDLIEDITRTLSETSASEGP